MSKSLENSKITDKFVGQKIREKRVALGFSQKQLGALVDVTFQQIQKYETGANRTAASMLYDLATIFGEPIGYFFDGLPSSSPRPGYKETTPPLAPSRETLELVRVFYSIKNSAIRDRLRKLLRSIAEDA